MKFHNPSIHHSKVSNFTSAAGVVPCGGPKQSPIVIHSADHIFRLVL